MQSTQISGGTVHDLPLDVKEALVADADLVNLWQSLTPLARNEWICWVESVKKSETRQNHITRLCEELKEGVRRPCCWAGCRHRVREGG